MDVINRGTQALPGFRKAARCAIGLGVGLALALGPVVEAEAQQGGVRLIRDAEIEATLRAYADPIFAAAGLDVSAVQVHSIEDHQINAFVSNGMQVFVNTGTLTQASTPNQ